MVNSVMDPLSVEPDSELGRLLTDAARTGTQLTVIVGNTPYDVNVNERATSTMQDDPDSSTPDAERVAQSIAGIRAAAGGWKGLIDGEDFKAYIRERRLTKNRPSVRW